VAWSQYADAKNLISAKWMNHVADVVRMAQKADLYVVLNIHWDGGWMDPTFKSRAAVNAKFGAFWTQIAKKFRDFDDRLLFAGTNEVHVKDNYGAPTAENAEVQNGFNQLFVKTVRATGGKNSKRFLVVQSYNTNIGHAVKFNAKMPVDSAKGKLMMEVHYYTPYQFTLMDKDADWGKMFYYWGAGNRSTTDTERNPTWGEEADLAKLFKSMKTQFVDKGIPVILGEFGAIRRSNLSGSNLTLHLASRAYYLKVVVQQAKANGMVPFYWDEGNLGSNGFGIFNRFNTSVADTQALNGLLDGLN
jgi:aryl-phospho-beta-D-glucosidase BglC (GH1 family)